MPPTTRSTEERLLRLSVWGAAAFAVTALVWGVAGREVAAGWAAGYAAAATLGCGVVVLLLRRGSTAGGALLRAESAQWLLDTILSAAILVGFTVAIVLQRTGREAIAAYVDPGMVAIVALWFLRLPWQLVREGWHGLMARTPRDGAGEAITAVVAEEVAAVGWNAGSRRSASTRGPP